jgi:hypothetical protein
MVNRGPEEPATPGTPDPVPPDSAVWNDIVARLSDVNSGPRVVRSGRDWDGTTQMDAAERQVDEEDGFVPTEPGPVFSGPPLTTLGWTLAVTIPIFWLVTAIFFPSIPRVVLSVSGVLFLTAIGILFWQMPRHRSPDDDDGAVL